MTTAEVLENAKRIKAAVSMTSTEQRNAALINMAAALEEDIDNILRVNYADLSDARSIMSDVMLDRLALNAEKIHSMATNMRSLAKLPDPLGVTIDCNIREDGLQIRKVSVPIGVIAVIYESRPNVTADVAAIAIKTGNVCILKSGKEAFGSSRAIVGALRKGLKKAGVSQNAIGFIEDMSRESVLELMTATGYVDLLIPRGGSGLIETCVKNARVPCIQTGTGICHIFIDEFADEDKALNIIENAKCSRPSVCNAAEVCLVHKDIAEEFLPRLHSRLVSGRYNNPVKLKLDECSYEILGGWNNCFRADADDFDTEFLDYVLAIKVVDNVKSAMTHISAHSTGHSDCIVTENDENAKLFVKCIDSSAVYVNASTRFTDGEEFGLFGEVGISTQKLHARGPMGLKELTSYKYVITGNGHIR